MRPLRLLAILVLWFFGISSSHAVTNVACVGDSITMGVGVNDPAQDSYPARLQKLLGTNYTVRNFGVSGATLLLSGDKPYASQPAYGASHGPPQPDIVVIMLGSNDSKPMNWGQGSNFVTTYKGIIRSYTNLASSPRVLMCTPPPCFGVNTPLIDPVVLATNISPLIRELGRTNGFQVIDMQLLLAGHNEWFPDNVHPNSPGTSVMAAIVYTALRGDTMNGSLPGLEISVPSATAAAFKWPSGGAGWVLQSTPVLGGTNLWPVVNNVIVNNGITSALTNSLTGSNTFFRLWNPSITN